MLKKKTITIHYCKMRHQRKIYFLELAFIIYYFYIRRIFMKKFIRMVKIYRFVS